ncbi:carboxy-S-adenosyl-L-methionine synthase CmoA [Alginatibacterium sediminis]|uniref:Carboxy-S-adenosyl-L-methionine synthase n=1 Tax=Alginatibacterium sediminis TaxID=2164068 RepID=A0A420EHP6_9ALTE|nr:carboxy-S-adenosyl-L-methionine synthase CmoA [Alginatibacterium sediminis]RKF20225.1 carboxy-S-adenosyl-L-methionine synthase CmoA [Alginatibacterium sediminis]
MPSTDTLFSKPLPQLGEFCFDEQVASVFPDMIKRSVPGYQDIVNTIARLAARHHIKGSNIYDLGCSLGACTLSMRRAVTQEGKIIGVDNSQAMLERCQSHLDAFRSQMPVELRCEDICSTDINHASVIVLNFTLQFIPLAARQALLDKIYQSLLPGGIVIISEKFQFEDELMQENINALHLDYKRANGYSELEISQKRSSLENVLIAETKEAHYSRLRSAGFSHYQTWYQCFNFGSILAIKSA